MKSLLLLSLLLGSTLGVLSKEQNLVKEKKPVVDPNLPKCLRAESLEKYHFDTACDLAEYNSKEKRRSVAVRRQKLMNGMGGVDHIPDEQTKYCPQTVENWQQPQHNGGNNELDEDDVYGMHTHVIFENPSSKPVVLILVRNGVEVSATNPTIIPPYNDPNAILQPGDWKSISALEGQIYYVRELHRDNDEGEFSPSNMGNILVQHQVGLVPIKNRYGHDLSKYCEKPNLPDVNTLSELPPDEQDIVVDEAFNSVDPEPKLEVQIQTVHKEVKKTKIRDPKWSRTHPRTHKEKCNFMHKGFRNTLEEEGCSIDMFFTGIHSPPPQETGGFSPMTCHEDFKFHLGLHPNPKDFMISWESRTKYEGTYIGHTWIARLSNNMDIVVDSFIVEPIRVPDCPNLKQKHSTNSKISTNVDVMNYQVDAAGSPIDETASIFERANSEYRGNVTQLFVDFVTH